MNIIIKPSLLAAAIFSIAMIGENSARASERGAALDSRLGTTGSNAQTGLPSGINISGGADSGLASVTGHYTWDDPPPGLGASTLAFKLSAPVGKQNSASIFPTDGNLLPGTSFEFSYSRTLIPGAYVAANKARDFDIYQRAQRTCLKVTPADRAKSDCGVDTDDPKFEASYLEKFFTDADRKAVADRAFYDAPLLRWGVSASVGYNAFDFRDPKTLAQQSENDTDVAASLFLERHVMTAIGSNGAAPAQVGLSGGAEYTDKYEDAKSQTLCHPAPATGPQECFTGPFGKPDRSTSGDAFLALRWAPPVDTSRTIGLKGAEFKAAYDFEGKGTTVGASIYLVGDDKGHPNGGLKFSWLPDHLAPVKGRNFNVGIFVGVPLNVFGAPGK